MNKYVKNRFATYFIGIENLFDYSHYTFYRLIEIISENFKIKTLHSISKLKSAKSSQIRTEQIKNEVKFIIPQLKNYLKNDTVLNSIMLKKIKLISQIYNLNDSEFQILEFKILLRFCSDIDYLSIFVQPNTTDYMLTKILNTDALLYDDLIFGLQNKGILSKDNSDCVNSKILRIISDNKIKTKAQMTKILLGETQKTNLRDKDFVHFKKEQKLLENILKSATKEKRNGINILLYGSVGTGKTQFAKLIAQNSKINMFEVDYPISDKQERSRYNRLNDLKSKQTILSNAENTCILFDEAEDVMNQFTSSTKGYFNNLLDSMPIPVIWTTNNIYNVDPAILRRMTYALEFRKLTEDERLVIWKNILRKNKFKVSNKKLYQLNKDYDVPPALINNAIKTTKLINGTEDDFEAFIENVAQVVYKKKNLKNKKEFEFSEYNENLVNTDIDTKNLTQRIKTSKKLNFSLCLYGEPGTGKSLYARYLAKELGIDVVFKRASDLIAPYVGETEQNIADAFTEAKNKKAMLIFDEADTFLQNRNNAMRSWEIAQVNEMLTWMESHEYPFVCTTNLLETLDEASLRRFTFKIKFDFLTKEQVILAFKNFWNIKNANIEIDGLTAGDFATVKKKADFLGISDIQELTKMLEDEVKLKQSKHIKNKIGF